MVSIAGINIETPLALAPMAGVTDVAFRTICREQGAGLTCTEMVSAKALCYQDKKTIPLLQLGDGEHPAAAQIFGSDPVCMQEGAAIAHEGSGADLIDINMGCPVPKVANSGDGSGLMRDPDKAVKVLEAVIRGKIPPGLGQGLHQLRGICQGHGAGGRRRRSCPRPHPQPDVFRHRQLGLDPGSQKGGEDPGHRQRRCL